MTLRRRQLLIGVAAPAAALALAFVGGGLLFAYMLLRSVDQSLQAQAAVESVSLFDGPGDGLHLHLQAAPHPGDAAAAAIYGEDGALLTSYPPGVRFPSRTLPASPLEPPRLETVDGFRRLVVTVAGRGRRVVLLVQRPLDTLFASVADYAMATAALYLGLLSLLATVQIRHAAWLEKRLSVLVDHVERLKEGDVSSPPARDPHGDAIGALREGLAEATRRLSLAARAHEWLIANAAHELRTPLSKIGVGVDVTLRRPREAAELREQLVSVRSEVDRLASVADALLDRAAIHAAGWDVRVEDLTAIVEDAVDAARDRAEERGVLVEGPEPIEAEAVVAAGAVRQAVDNLLSNAVKHSPDEGLVSVAITREGDVWRVSVSDEGPGIPPAQRELVFEPFHRVERDRPGVGLGLTLVREVAERHGGNVYAEAAASGGARLVLELPTHQPG